ncbi:hypothetical protein [Microbacterium sp. BK668]|uniref:hypothetical protein n=1 Tax=Microbacterium sp. BK668 TaxID=2512118 RepID=UPI00105D4EE1|nr:hypothetical protein [Microbacterium sp. BK668]
MDTQFTGSGNPYEVIDVSISGDRTRLFVPHVSPPSSTSWVAVLWYYHANGSSYTAVSSAFKYGADPLVDYGAISVCGDNGGPNEFANAKAVTAHRNAIAYVTALWRVYYSFGRSNSGGGALMCWAFGTGMVPRRHGMYLASSVYDMESLYEQDPTRVGYPYGYSTAALQATNPARLGPSAWTGMRIRSSYSTVDERVPPQDHCLALTSRAAPVAVEASLLPHDGGGTANGHWVPGTINREMVSTFRRWANL